eukprot:757163-Hanusia_phi.AAC.1
MTFRRSQTRAGMRAKKGPGTELAGRGRFLSPGPESDRRAGVNFNGTVRDGQCGRDSRRRWGTRNPGQASRIKPRNPVLERFRGPCRRLTGAGRLSLGVTFQRF